MSEDRMKVVLQYRASPGFRAQLAAATPPWMQLVVVDEADRARFAREMTDAQVLLHVLEPVTAAVIAAAPQLRLIQKIGVGVNTIDLAAAAAHGVQVANMPGTNSQAVAEMALALLLAVLRRVVWLDHQTRAGQGWQLALPELDQLGEIHGRTVGLVGFGEVPRRLAPVLQALGAEVVYTTRQDPGTDARWRAWEDLLACSDVVSLHVPLNPQTRHLLDAAAFARMKPGSVLVNTARGGLVDEAALAEALRSGRLRGAGLDVMDAEPLPAGSALAQLPQVVLTPHLAWLTPETLQRSLQIAFENCARMRSNQALRYPILQ
jgi:phosphoglycerate dehydrogenase-like enzyme